MRRKSLLVALVLALLLASQFNIVQAQQQSGQNNPSILRPDNRPFVLRPSNQLDRIKIKLENVRPPNLVLTKENFESLSPYQEYVTPNVLAVQALAAQVNGGLGAYEEAVSWVWVSDETLHGVDEKWLKPQDFLTLTPNYPTNPARGRKASDCESQAYTLVSLIRAIGAQTANVRVAIGLVEFGDQIGGHAWAEVFIDNCWMAVEVTSGPYWDDDTNRLVERNGYPYDYFGTYEYPTVEVWAYFNDEYYYNTSTGEGNAPEHWKTGSVPKEDQEILLVLYVALAATVGALAAQIALAVRGRKSKKSSKK